MSLLSLSLVPAEPIAYQPYLVHTHRSSFLLHSLSLLFPTSLLFSDSPHSFHFPFIQSLIVPSSCLLKSPLPPPRHQQPLLQDASPSFKESLPQSPPLLLLKNSTYGLLILIDDSACLSYCFPSPITTHNHSTQHSTPLFLVFHVSHSAGRPSPLCTAMA
ncbi:MAG: hypothetical protein JOS17DRAFT_239500 [Linnemannia elongata]|nr:MAG: hypothetical protein JOS17DRAFT_239500 [Linnemannia elongata]